MNWLNTHNRYGYLNIALHWVIALGIFFLFALGLWMMGLDYYDPLYLTAPALHKSIGCVLVFFMLFRLLLRLLKGVPQPLSTVKPWELRLATLVHALFYFLILVMFVSGYLLTTIKGQALEVFSLFKIPPIIVNREGLEPILSSLHELTAFTIVGLAIIHAGAALKHHFFDKDGTLMRMLGR